MIQNLPIEIINKISYSLSPADALQLAYTNSNLYDIIKPRLYSSIIFDSNKYPYDHESIQKSMFNKIPSVYGLNPTNVLPTKIKSIFALNLILRNLIENPHYCSYIQILEFSSMIPDISETELFDQLFKVMPNLINLKILNWFVISLYLSCDLISCLPMKQNLITLCGNFKKFELLNLNPNMNLNLSGNLNLNLQHLNVSGFNSVENLSEINLNSFPNLKNLTIGKNSSSNYINNIPSVTNNLSNQYIISDLIEIQEPLLINGYHYLKSLFSHEMEQKLNLSRLELNDIIISSNDAQYLINNINLENLQELSISNCTELLFDESYNSSPIRRTPPTSLFLDKLLPHMKNLSKFNINLNNELYFNEKIYNFIEKLPHSLEKISIYLTFNNYDNINYNLMRLFLVLQKHKHSLISLNFNFNIINLSTNLNINNIIKPTNFDYSIQSIKNLSNLENLKYLELPINQFQVSKLFGILSNCNKIKFIKIHLFNSNDTSTPSPCSSMVNSLICQDYFSFPNTETYNINFEKIEQFKNYCFDFKSSLPNLNILNFVNNNDYFVFDCGNGQACLKHGLPGYFDQLVDYQEMLL